MKFQPLNTEFLSAYLCKEKTYYTESKAAIDLPILAPNTHKKRHAYSFNASVKLTLKY